MNNKTNRAKIEVNSTILILLRREYLINFGKNYYEGILHNSDHNNIPESSLL